MGQTVLVVDDEVEIADLVELYLKNEDFAVRKFYNGHDALECVRTEELDLAILDVMLPDIDGFTLCARIREEHFWPIIMLTAKVEDIDKIMGLTIGADDYITKPSTRWSSWRGSRPSCGATRATTRPTPPRRSRRRLSATSAASS